MTGSAHSSEVLVGEGEVEVSSLQSPYQDCVKGEVDIEHRAAARTGEEVHLPLPLGKHRCVPAPSSALLWGPEAEDAVTRTFCENCGSPLTFQSTMFEGMMAVRK